MNSSYKIKLTHYFWLNAFPREVHNFTTKHHLHKIFFYELVLIFCLYYILL